MSKISELSAAGTLDGTEKTVIVQSGVTVRSTTQATANLYKGTAGADLASAATVNLGAATGNIVHITGTTTITSFGTVGAGTERTVIFDGALTLTHNGTSLILPTGASITTAAGDTARMMSEGSGNWRCLAYNRKDGTALGGATIANDSVTYAKIQNVSATDKVLGRATAGAGDVEEITCTSFARSLMDDTDAATARATLGVSGENIAEPVTAISSSSGTLTINCASGDYFTCTLTENITTISFSNLPAAGKAQTIMVRITQHASAAKTVAWPASFKWAGGSAGAVSTTLSAVDVLAITTFDQGTRWEATLAKAFA